MESPDIYNKLPQCNLSVNIHDRCENCGDCWTDEYRQEYNLNQLNNRVKSINKEIKWLKNRLKESPDDFKLKVDLQDICLIKKDILTKEIPTLKYSLSRWEEGNYLKRRG